MLGDRHVVGQPRTGRSIVVTWATSPFAPATPYRRNGGTRALVEEQQLAGVLVDLCVRRQPPAEAALTARGQRDRVEGVRRAAHVEQRQHVAVKYTRSVFDESFSGMSLGLLARGSMMPTHCTSPAGARSLERVGAHPAIAVCHLAVTEVHRVHHASPSNQW